MAATAFRHARHPLTKRDLIAAHGDWKVDFYLMHGTLGGYAIWMAFHPHPEGTGFFQRRAHHERAQGQHNQFRTCIALLEQPKRFNG